ncbi:MAG: hypothetical protein QM667_05160 [Asticcacaulis sp.]
MRKVLITTAAFVAIGTAAFAENAPKLGDKYMYVIVRIVPDARAPEDIIDELRSEPALSIAQKNDPQGMIASGMATLKFPWDSKLSLSGGTFNPDEEVHTMTVGTGGISFKAYTDPATGAVYLGGRVRAGHVALYGLSVQTQWGACFNKGSHTFKGEAGRYYYLGEYAAEADVRKVSYAISARQSPSYLQQSAMAQIFDLSDRHVTWAQPEAYAASPDKQQIETLFGELFGTKVDTQAPESRATPFGTGYDAFHVTPICAGYYPKKKSAQ